MAARKCIGRHRDGRRFSPLELAAHERSRQAAKASRKTQAQRRQEASWLVKVPRSLCTVEQFFEANPEASCDAVAKALGVSRRTVERWRQTGGSRLARIAMFWLSAEGMSFWDCELHARFVIAVQTNEALWREVRELRRKVKELESESFAPLLRKVGS